MYANTVANKLDRKKRAIKGLFSTFMAMRMNERTPRPSGVGMKRPE